MRSSVDFAFVIDGAPEIMGLSSDLCEHLVQMPLPRGDLPHVRSYLSTDLPGEVSAKPINPEPDAFMADIDAAFVQHVFDISKR